MRLRGGLGGGRDGKARMRSAWDGAADSATAVLGEGAAWGDATGSATTVLGVGAAWGGAAGSVMTALGVGAADGAVGSGVVCTRGVGGAGVAQADGGPGWRQVSRRRGREFQDGGALTVSIDS